jgi:hypothetical protein
MTPARRGMSRALNSDPGTSARSGGSAAAGSSADHRWTLTALVLGHKRVAAGSIVVVIALIAVTIFTTVSSPSRQSLSDSASCTQWAAGTPAQKIAYSHLYINEYGRFPNTARYAAAVETAIDTACTKASYLGEADDISVLASLRHAF